MTSRSTPPDSFMQTELASELYVDEVLDGAGRIQYLDRSVSVSASTGPALHWLAGADLDSQHRRFLNGS